MRMTEIAAGLVMCACFAAAAVAGESDDALRAKRLEFIKEFHRVAYDSTAEDAQFLRIIVAGAQCKRGVEIGSFKGFGAINMGMSFERNGGQLITLEIDSKIADECRENLKKVQLEKVVTVITGDALETLPKLEGEFDFMFIDAKKDDYFKYLKAIEPKLKAGAIIIADNTIQSAKQMKDFLDYLATNPNYDAVTIHASMEKKDGMTIAFKLK